MTVNKRIDIIYIGNNNNNKRSHFISEVTNKSNNDTNNHCSLRTVVQMAVIYIVY